MMIVCVRCGKFFRPEKNGFVVEEGMPFGSYFPDVGPTGWGSYKLWMGDKLKCRSCGVEIVSGFGLAPIAEHYMTEKYARLKKIYPPGVFVEDCA